MGSNSLSEKEKTDRGRGRNRAIPCSQGIAPVAAPSAPGLIRRRAPGVTAPPAGPLRSGHRKRGAELLAQDLRRHFLDFAAAEISELKRAVGDPDQPRYRV